jgi:hypothetical protein
MKLITNIQSFTDVITNSSSSVFIMHESDTVYYEGNVPEDCLIIQEITLDWIKEHHWEWELILRACDIDFDEICHKCTRTYGPRNEYSYEYWNEPDDEDWKYWVNKNFSKFGPILGKYYVEIEDHFENAYDIIDNAYGDAVASDSRH